MELTESFVRLLQVLAPVFTAPSFATFQLLMTGWVLSTRHRYVTDLIVSSDSVDKGHFSDYHRFFSHAAWNLDQLWRLLAQLAIGASFGPDALILLAADDTLCRKRGLSLFGAGMHHDPLISSRAVGHQAAGANPHWARCCDHPFERFVVAFVGRQWRRAQAADENVQNHASRSKSCRSWRARMVTCVVRIVNN